MQEHRCATLSELSSRYLPKGMLATLAKYSLVQDDLSVTQFPYLGNGGNSNSFTDGDVGPIGHSPTEKGAATMSLCLLDIPFDPHDRVTCDSSEIAGVQG